MSKLTTFKQIAIKPLAYIARRARTLKFALPLTAMLATSCKPSEPPSEKNYYTSTWPESRIPQNRDELLAFIRDMPQVQAALRNGSLKDVVFIQAASELGAVYDEVATHPAFPATLKSKLAVSVPEQYAILTSTNPARQGYAIVLADKDLIGLRIPLPIIIGPKFLSSLADGQINLEAVRSLIRHELVHVETSHFGLEVDGSRLSNKLTRRLNPQVIGVLGELGGTCVNFNDVYYAPADYPPHFVSTRKQYVMELTLQVARLQDGFTERESAILKGILLSCGYKEIRSDGAIINLEGEAILKPKQ